MSPRNLLGLALVGFFAVALTIPVASAETVLRVAAAKTPNGVDHDYHVTHEDHVIRASLYEKLLALGRQSGPDGLSLPSFSRDDLVGRLAESWSLSEDGRTLTVKLREGVMSHAGNELTAEDVQWTWDRSWALNAVGAFYATAILNLSEPSWEATGRYTWQITTPNFNSLLVVLMVNNDLDIVDATEAKKHASEDDPWATKWLATNAAGHGPYRLTDWVPGERVVLEAFGDYYRGKPAIDRVIYREVPEAANRYALVASGSVDVAENLPPRFLRQASTTDGLKLWRTDGNRIFRLDISHTKGITSDARVRKALYHATAMDEILAAVFQGYGNPSLSPVPAIYPGYSAEAWAYDYDPERARALIEEAGAVGGELTIAFDSSSTIQETTAVILKSAYEAAGIKVNLNEMSSAAYTSKFYTKELQAFFQTAFPILPDPGYALALTYTCGAFLNTNEYCNEHVDGMLRTAIATRDEAERMELYREAQRIMIAEDAVQIWLAEPGWQLVTRENVSGVGWDTPNVYWFYDLRLN